MKVVAIVGSPHSDGNTSYLAGEALKEIASLGIETEKIVLGEYKIGPCLAHDGCQTFKVCKVKDDAPGIIAKFNDADGIILASPVYFYDVTAQMKMFIDRNFFTFTHDQKKKARYAGLIALGGGGGADETIDTLKRFVGLPQKDCFILKGYTKQEHVKNFPELVAKAREMGRNMAAKLKGKK
jgi:multimeric flavodoxin WrbA